MIFSSGLVIASKYINWVSGRMAASMAAVLPYLDQGNSLGALINGFLLAPEYRARFLP